MNTGVHCIGLAGEGDIQKAEIAAAVDAISDVGTEIMKVHFEKDEAKKVDSQI